jgi:hypothetical protein
MFNGPVLLLINQSGLYRGPLPIHQGPQVQELLT